jgi:hypothetical protein
MALGHYYPPPQWIQPPAKFPWPTPPIVQQPFFNYAEFYENLYAAYVPAAYSIQLAPFAPVFAQGDQPPPRTDYVTRSIIGQWPPPWQPAQSAISSAGWNVALPQNPPFGYLPKWQIWVANQPAAYAAQHAYSGIAEVEAAPPVSTGGHGVSGPNVVRTINPGVSSASVSGSKVTKDPL